MPRGLRALSLAEMVRREMLPLQRSSARAPHVQNRRFVSRSRRLGSRPGVQRGRSPFCREYEGVPHNYYYSFSWGGETPITQPPIPALRQVQLNPRQRTHQRKPHARSRWHRHQLKAQKRAGYGQSRVRPPTPCLSIRQHIALNTPLQDTAVDLAEIGRRGRYRSLAASHHHNSRAAHDIVCRPRPTSVQGVPLVTISNLDRKHPGPGQQPRISDRRNRKRRSVVVDPLACYGPERGQVTLLVGAHEKNDKLLPPGVETIALNRRTLIDQRGRVTKHVFDK